MFITFEGGEGCGKSLQTRALYRRLVRLAVPVVLTHEPGGTRLGERITRWLKWSKEELSPLTELLLFNTSRSHLVAEVIRPALRDGKIVISDRFADSTLAYQGYGRGLDLATVKAVNQAATGGLKPDLTILLDIEAEAGLARKGKKPDRFEKESLDFHRRVREGFLKMAKEEPSRWLVIDATLSRKAIAEIIWRRVKPLLRSLSHKPTL
ncbi:MAG: dTMP kinase [Chloroflexota bacterium]